MNRGQIQYKMRGSMMRAARRNAMRGYRGGRCSSSSSNSVGGAVVVLLIIIAAALLAIVSVFGVAGWFVLFLFGVPIMAGWLVYLAQQSSAHSKAEIPQTAECKKSELVTGDGITMPVKPNPLATFPQIQTKPTMPLLQPRSRRSYIYRPQTQYVRSHSRITKSGRVVQVRGHLRSHK